LLQINDIPFVTAYQPPINNPLNRASVIKFSSGRVRKIPEFNGRHRRCGLKDAFGVLRHCAIVLGQII
jgi:hypothetical protein